MPTISSHPSDSSDLEDVIFAELEKCSTDHVRKMVIMGGRELGLLSDDQTAFFFYAFGLKAA